MKIDYKVSDNFRFEVEVPGPEVAFKAVAQLTQIFGHDTCGNCGCHDLRPVHRTPQGYDFYSWKCNGCGYELKMGKAKEGGHLYPKGWEPPYVKGESNGSQQNGNGGGPNWGNEYNQDPPQQQQAPPQQKQGSDEIPW